MQVEFLIKKNNYELIEETQHFIYTQSNRYSKNNRIIAYQSYFNTTENILVLSIEMSITQMSLCSPFMKFTETSVVNIS